MNVLLAATSGSAFLALAAASAFLGGNGAPPGAPPALATVPDALASKGPVLQIHARELWGAGGERLADALLVIEGGRIRSIGSAREIDPAQPLVVHDGVVTAGMIACRTQSGASAELQDDTRSVLPGARAVHAVDLHSVELGRALAAGITSVGIAPGPLNLVGGLACVVKTAGGRVVAPEATLALSLSSGTLGRSTVSGGFLFGAAEEEGHAELGEGELPGGAMARPDGGPEWSARTQRGTREPTSYTGAVTMLRELFGRGEGVFGRARKGELPVTIEAWDRHEVLRAATLARELGLVGAVRGAPLAGDPAVLAALKASGLGVILGPFSSEQTRPSLEGVARLAAAGVPVAFALDGPANAPDELRLSAVRALRAGASREVVWKALTEDGARLAGVADATGKLAPGLAADLVLWSGDPLDLRSRPEVVYVDGQRAWPSAGPARGH